MARRTTYGDRFYQQCLKRSADPPTIKECGGLCGDLSCCNLENNNGLPPSGSGVYLCYWLQASQVDITSFPYDLFSIGNGATLPNVQDFRQAAILTSTPAYPKHAPSLLQVHFHDSTAVLYTKNQVYQWGHWDKDFFYSDWESNNVPESDYPRPFLKIPTSINTNIDDTQQQHHAMQRHGGSGSDVWTISRPDLVPDVKKRLNKMAASTNDRPIPRYQMIIDPNQFVRKDGTWVPSEFDISETGQSVGLVGGVRAHWMNTDTIQAVTEPVLQASLPLLSRLERPKMLLEGERLQVVIKAQRIILPPSSTDGNDSEYIGLWHVDGEHESIAAVVLFYYNVSPAMHGGNMEFIDRKPLAVLEGNEVFRRRQASELLRGPDRPHANCSVPIEQGTLLVFSNYQMVHRVLKMINTSSDAEASRDFVALFVMDPAAPALVPARCHLANRYIYEQTLKGLCLSTDQLASAGEKHSLDGASPQVFLSDRPLDLVLEYAGIQPSLQARRATRNRLLHSQLKPRGEIGYDSTKVYMTGNGCFTMIGWLDRMLDPLDPFTEENARETEYPRHTWGLNRAPEKLGRGLSETLSIPSSDLQLQFEEEEGDTGCFWCDVCQEPIVDFQYPSTKVQDFDICDKCLAGAEPDFLEHHSFGAPIRVDYRCSVCDKRIPNIR